MTKEELRDLVAVANLTKAQKLLFILAYENQSSKSRARVIEIGCFVGLNEIKKWNVSDILGKSKGLAVSTKAGWELSTAGQRFVNEHVGKKTIPKPVHSLKENLAKITDRETERFILESIKCFEVSSYRAAIVFSWVGAVYVLQKFVLDNKLKEFNSEAARRDSKWKNAKTTDDMSRMSEGEFLDVLDSLSILGRNVKKELKNCLDLRNGCGHPNSLEVGEHKVAAHIECLIDNVFAKVIYSAGRNGGST